MGKTYTIKTFFDIATKYITTKGIATKGPENLLWTKPQYFGGVSYPLIPPHWNMTPPLKPMYGEIIIVNDFS